MSRPAQQQPVKRVVIYGGMPDPAPCGDAIAEADPCSPHFLPMLQLRAYISGTPGVSAPAASRQRLIVAGGLPDHEWPATAVALSDEQRHQYDKVTGGQWRAGQSAADDARPAIDCGKPVDQSSVVDEQPEQQTG